MNSSRQKLLATIQSRYGVGPLFARTYLEYWQLGYNREYQSLEEILALPAPQSSWFSYAISSNQRGEQTCQRIVPHLPPQARRYLDIGCGYGGSLVAFSHLGLEVRGIDIDTNLLRLAEANCADHNLQHCVLNASILEEGLPDRLGTFDLITLSCVIEHVPDVSGTLRNATQLLSPGGALVMDIPNKHGLAVVASDPHYCLFGLTLLERPQAVEVFRCFFSMDYGVGDYYELDFYRDQLTSLGCDSRLMIPPTRFWRMPLLGIKFGLGYVRFLRQQKRLPVPLWGAIHTAARNYLSGLFKNFLHLPFHPAHARAFQVKYLPSVWMLLARKPQ